MRQTKEILHYEGVPELRHWPRLPRAAVGAPSLAVLKARLDGAGSNLGWWEVSLPPGGGLEVDSF